MAVIGLNPGAMGGQAHAAGPDYPYQDVTLPFSVRAADLVSRMTLEEKYNQLGAMQPHAGGWGTKAYNIFRLGVKQYGYWGEANHGIYFPVLSGSQLPSGTSYTMWPQSMAMSQTWNTELTSKMGTGIADEARVTYNTTCPPGGTPIIDINTQTNQGRACYGLTYWSPNQNMNRDPRWGRADEAYAEDPLLTGDIAGAFVVGLQGNTTSKNDTVPSKPSDYVQAVATPKHYLANNSEANRNYGTSNVSERLMHEFFLPAFKASAGDAGARSLMTAYNAISVREDYTADYPSAGSYELEWTRHNGQAADGKGTPGTPAAATRYAIETLLRRTYGFDGFIVSDCDAITRVHGTGTSGHSWRPVQLDPDRNTQINKAQGNAWALKAGTDLDCSGGDYTSTTGLVVSQRQGLATEADIDVALVRAFTARFQMGEFDPVADVPFNDVSYSLAAGGNPDVKLASNAHRAVAHESALEAPVLLKNDGTLPFGDAGSTKTVAVGHRDALTNFYGGSYSGPTAVNTTMGQALVNHIEGTGTVGSNTVGQWLFDRTSVFTNVLDANGTAINTSVCASTPCDPTADANTVEYKISQADNIVVVAGHRNNDGGEGSDRADVALPRMQAELIGNSIAPLAQKYGKKVVVWLQGKSIFDISLFRNHPGVGAIVWTSFNGMYQGKAMAELLFNETVTLEDNRQVVANFSGKLPVTWYSDVLGQLGLNTAPTYAVQHYEMTKAEGAKCGRTYLYYQVGTDCAAPDYVFGHGLSYSPFVYGAPTLSTPSITPDGSVTVTVPVSNQVANYPGKAVVQVYAKAPSGANGDDRPLKQLKGYAKTGVITGTPEDASITIKGEDLWYWDDAADKRVYPTGAWTILAGPSSADADLKSVTLTVTGSRTAGVDVVSAQPDGHELNLMTPDNRINAMLSVTKHDTSFWDPKDPALKVTYTSSDPAVATVDTKGTVTPVSTGAVLITVTAAADGETKQTSFPVVVTSGLPTPAVTDSSFANAYTYAVDFGDVKVPLEEATTTGVELGSELVDLSSGTTVVGATVSYQIAPMDTSTAGATVTTDGVLTATRPGFVRVTVTYTTGGISTSESAMIRIAETVDKEALQAAVDVANTQVAGDYTTSSWTAADLATVIPDAQAVLDDPEATQPEVDAATDVVNAALAKLVPRGDPAVLAALIAAVNSLNGKLGGYTSASVTALQTALTSAQAVYADRADKTQPQLDAAASSLQTALSGLVVAAPVVDKAVLQAARDAASALSNTNGTYTATSWSALQSALTSAGTVLGNASATQAQVDAAAKALNTALAGLVVSPPVVDKAVLQSVTDAAQAMTNPSGKYTADSWSTLQAKIADAVAVLGNASATQAQVDAAAKAVNTAIAGLAIAPDKAVLQSVTDAAQAMTNSSGKYTASSWSALQAKIADAVAVLGNASATQAQVDAAAKALNAAITDLVVAEPAVNKAVLQSVTDAAQAMTNPADRYTATSWAALQTAIAEAQQVLGNSSATQAQVDAAVTKVHAAVAELVPTRSAPIVTDKVVDKVKLNQSQLQVVKGRSLVLEEAVYYTNEKLFHPSYAGQVTWKSSNPAVAAVDGNGKVTGKKVGSATITVTAKANDAKGKKVSTSIKVQVVKKKAKAKVTKVTAAVPKTMKLGQTAFITGTYASAKATGVKVKYSSSKPDIVIIDKVGRLVAWSKGTEKIIVKAGGKTARYTITVK